MTVVQATGLSFTVLGREILRDISFSLAPGDRLMLVGASGSGKSTLLQMLNRLQSPTRGALQFQERDYTAYAPETLRRQIVLVPQEARLLGMTVQETLLYPLHLQRFTKGEIQQRWLRWQDLLQIPEEWLDRNEALLSGGQKQWVAIARGLLMEPDVLLLDEPTSALDLGRIQQLEILLKTYQQQRNIPMAIATHSLDFAEALGTHLMHIEQGQIKTYAPSTTIHWTALRETLRNSLTGDQAETW